MAVLGKASEEAWSEGLTAFADLGLTQQRALHDYFRMAERLSDKEAIAHRRQVTMGQPLCRSAPAGL